MDSKTTSYEGPKPQASVGEHTQQIARSAVFKGMEYLNKLKTTVSGALPGNPVTREFEIQNHQCSAGPGLLWKVYNGIKRSTKQEVSIFFFEKKLIERYSKRDKDLICDALKRGVSQLTRLRHPKILSVLHPMQESRDSLAFVTEPVLTSLANLLSQHDNMPSPLPNELKDYKLYDVEIKYGFLQVTEGLTFLHSNVKLVHNNICPSSIVLNKNGNWKLAGFDCCIPNANTGEQAAYYPFQEWNPSIPSVIQPSLDYLAPEYCITQSVDTASDMFSLGVLFYSVFNVGKAIYKCHEEWSEYKRNVEELRNLKMSIFGSLPEEIRDHVKLMLNTEPTVRPDADQLSKIPFFEDVGSMTLQYLDTLMQRDNLQKSQFFKGLPQVIAKLPKRVSIQRILPCLATECNNHNMVPFVLPSLLLIAEQVDEHEYTRHIMPALIPILQIKEPIQIMLIFLQNMNLLLSKTPQQDIRNHVLPMLYHALESDTPQLQELCLNILPTFASLVEYSSLKNAVVPRIKKLCLTTSSLNIRVQSLVCLGKLLEHMDKWYVLDDIFPILQQIPSREPGVLMSILGIYKVTMSHKKLGITKEVMANKVLPYIIPLAIDNNLNLQQFNAFMSTIKEMTTKVESEHRGKLEQLDSIQKEQRTLQHFTQESAKDQLNLVPGISSESKQETMMDRFMSGFGMLSTGGSEKSEAKAVNGIDSSAPKESKPAEPKIGGKAPQVQLTLEEKQRLAQAQEMQTRLKAQHGLQPASSASTSLSSMKTSSSSSSSSSMGIQPKPASQHHKAPVKDLTSTLLTSDMMSSQPKPNYTGNMSANNYSSSSSFSMTSTPMSSGFSTAASTNSTFGSSTMGGSMGGTGFGAQPAKPQQPSKPVDMSAFDNLLPTSSSNRPKSMSQMKPQPMGQTGGGGFGGMAQAPMMNNMNMMGGAPRMMPAQGMMGNQQRMMGNQSMMGNMGMMGNQGPPPMGGYGMMPNNMNAMGANTNFNMQARPNQSTDFDKLFG